jgi:predicted amidophosphoribosyltransferase
MQRALPARWLLDGVLDVLAPARCLSCRALGEVPWCAACRSRARPLPEGCSRCAAPRGGTHACWPADAPIAATIACFDYRGPVADAVVAAKLGGARAAWGPLAEALAARVAAAAPDVDAVTWVTTPRARARARGGDHAERLGQAVARGLDLPAVRLLSAAADQRDRDRYRARTRLPGTRLLLVDDVLTTGATAWRAAAALVAASADPVVLAVLARAGSHPLGATPRLRPGS